MKLKQLINDLVELAVASHEDDPDISFVVMTETMRDNQKTEAPVEYEIDDTDLHISGTWVVYMRET